MGSGYRDDFPRDAGGAGKRDIDLIVNVESRIGIGTGVKAARVCASVGNASEGAHGREVDHGTLQVPGNVHASAAAVVGLAHGYGCVGIDISPEAAGQGDGS